MVSLATLREAKKKAKEVKAWAESKDIKGEVGRIKAKTRKVGKRATLISEQMSQVGNLESGFGQDVFQFEMPPVKKGRKKKTRRKQPEKEFDMFDIL